MYFVTLEGLRVRVSADVYMTMIRVVRDKCVVSNALIRVGSNRVLILSKSHGTRVTCSWVTGQN